jgi:hypothetical protein
MTYIFDKENFIDLLKNIINDDEIVIYSTSPEKVMSGACKKHGKVISIGFNPKIFKNPETINDILHSKFGGLIIMDKKFLSDDVNEKLKENEK